MAWPAAETGEFYVDGTSVRKSADCSIRNSLFSVRMNSALPATAGEASVMAPRSFRAISRELSPASITIVTPSSSG
jgi:hypothetical protein